MNNDSAVSTRRSGLSILWDTIVAPNAAFDSLRLEPRWLIAFLAAIVVGTIGVYLAVPANLHIATVLFPKMVAQNPSLAGLSADKQQEALKNLESFYTLLPLFTPVVTAFSLVMSAAVIFVAALVAKAKTSFKLAFAIACNVGFIYYGLFNLVVGIMTILRGPQTFDAPVDLFTAIPCLAWLVPGGPVKLVAFLSLVNPFTIWAFALNVIGMHRAAGMSYVPASIVSALFFLATALSVAAGAQ